MRLLKKYYGDPIFTIRCRQNYLNKKIQQKYSNFKISVSYTTRLPRPNEVDGVDYNFVSKTKFEELINKNQFYEYAKIFDNYYGTLKKV